MRALFGRTAARQHQRCGSRGLVAGNGGNGSNGSALFESGCGTTMRASASASASAPPTEPAPAADRANSAAPPSLLPHYADYPIDRASDLRSSSSDLSALFASPQSRLLPVLAPTADGAARVLVVEQQPATTAAAPLAPAWVKPASAVANALADGGGLAGCIFLGLDADGAGVFAGRVRPDAAGAVQQQQQQQQQQQAAGNPSSSSSSWVAARTAGPDMTAGDAALVATAAGIASWHSAALFDGGTGLPTLPRRGGHSRGVDPQSATNTNGRPPRALYPRVDPATIMLVREGGWALLGRKAEWPPGRWSTLAGFVECGETFEQCVARETLEESGVRVRHEDVRYVESQPWPFPRSLMVGFYAAPELEEEQGADEADPYGLLPPGAARRAAMDVGVTSDELRQYLLPRLPPARPASGELEDCRWFFRGWVRRALRRHAREQQGAASAEPLFHVPGHYSLGNRLVHGWLAEGAGAEDEDHDDDDDDNEAKDDPLGRFPSVDVGPPGETFKYVLLRVFEPSGRSKLAVHGHPAAEYHNHVLQRAKSTAAALGLSASAVEVLGGGRIRHDSDGGGLHVYGYSAAFGPSPHEVSAAILRRWFPFSEVTVSYEGY
jgi:NADH pyrophosphatase NudC (nudix superfamily)